MVSGQTVSRIASPREPGSAHTHGGGTVGWHRQHGDDIQPNGYRYIYSNKRMCFYTKLYVNICSGIDQKLPSYPLVVEWSGCGRNHCDHGDKHTNPSSPKAEVGELRV